MTRDDLRHLPSIQALARMLAEKGVTVSEEHAVGLARSVQDATRSALIADTSRGINAELARQIDRIERLFARSRYGRVLNGTGVIIHTNLGRAPVSEETAVAMREAASGAIALEIEPDTGRRGGRMTEISNLLRLLTGAEAALVVNNNAAAILLTLSALVSGQGVAVSRAEAVEIGGGFRIPEVLSQSGATLLEVGTTNRTYADDYRSAGLGPGGAILKVHSSNFAIAGFVAHPSLVELRGVADETGCLLIEDLGSGTLLDTAGFGVDHEPTIAESIAAGVDIVTFSGDKLLGGPQAGIIAGRAELIARIGRAPLARAVRADKVTLAGIAATLHHYLRGDAIERIPVLRMMATTPAELRVRAERIVAKCRQADIPVEIERTVNYIGGGSLPGQSLPGVAIAVASGGDGEDQIARRLRTEPGVPVYGRIEEGRLLFELRAIAPEDDETLVLALAGVIAPGDPG